MRFSACRGPLLNENLEIFVRAVADWFISGIFAATEMYSFIFGSVEILWFKFRSLMGTIAKWLVSTSSTSAPMIFTTRFNVHVIGFFLCNDWFGHHFLQGYFIKLLYFILTKLSL